MSLAGNYLFATDRLERPVDRRSRPSYGISAPPQGSLTRPSGIGGGPLFTEPVVPNGYNWWYVDALSDDGRHALTIIAFIGSVFSPYYAAARREAHAKGTHGANPMDYCAINVALYEDVGQPVSQSKADRSHSRGHWWAMTERASRHVSVSDTSFAVGPSALTWNGSQLVIDIDEVTVPIPSRLRGQIVVEPYATFVESYPLDPAGQHHWRPIAPCSRVEVKMKQPGLTWGGTAYVDSNHGSAPLESAFCGWDWSRAKCTGRRKDDGPAAPTIVVYDIDRVDGTHLSLAKRFDISANGDGHISDFVAPHHSPLPRSGWRIPRSTACDAGAACTVIKTVEDAPFYARSIVSSSVKGADVIAVHESLSLERFSRRWVQTLLPFRMPRRR
jgi:carotenoid 1,2-hydratase